MFHKILLSQVSAKIFPGQPNITKVRLFQPHFVHSAKIRLSRISAGNFAQPAKILKKNLAEGSRLKGEISLRKGIGLETKTRLPIRKQTNINARKHTV